MSDSTMTLEQLIKNWGYRVLFQDDDCALVVSSHGTYICGRRGDCAAKLYKGVWFISGEYTFDNAAEAVAKYMGLIAGASCDATGSR